MQRCQQVQRERLCQRTQEKGLIIVHTGNGKGKTTAAWMCAIVGHGFRVAIVQFLKGAGNRREKAVLEHWSDQISFHA
jgi:cob(I)alamin adenosyltransferase